MKNIKRSIIKTVSKIRKAIEYAIDQLIRDPREEFDKVMKELNEKKERLKHYDANGASKYE